MALLGRSRVAAQAGADAGDQLLEVERLSDVVVGAGLQTGDAVRGVVASGEDDHGQLVLRGSHIAQDVEAVASREAEVEDQEVEVRVLRHRARADAVGDDGRGEAAGAKALLEERCEARLVLGDQDACQRLVLVVFVLIGRDDHREGRAYARIRTPPRPSRRGPRRSPSRSQARGRRRDRGPAAGPPLANRSKIRSCSWSSIPSPSSRTQMRISPPLCELPIAITWSPSGVLDGVLGEVHDG